MVPSRLILAPSRIQPHVKESGFVPANRVEVVHDPLHCPDIRLASMVIVSSALIDDVVHESTVFFEVQICFLALVLSIVEVLEIVPIGIIELTLVRVFCQI